MNSKLATFNEIGEILQSIQIDPTATGDQRPHRVLKRAFASRGWITEERISESEAMRFDAYKLSERIAIEFQTSHVVHCYKDYLKFMVGFNAEKIDLGIEMVYSDQFVEDHSLPPWKPTLNKVSRELKSLFKPIITVPILVVGMED